MVVILIDQQDLKTVPLAFYEAMRTQGWAIGMSRQ